MKDIKSNWIIKYGFLTGEPDRSYRRVWNDAADDWTLVPEPLVVSLCGTFWRAVRSTVVLGAFLFGLWVVLLSIWQKPVVWFGVGGSIIAFLAFGYYALIPALKWFFPRLATGWEKTVDNVIAPVGIYVVDGVSAIKHRYCPLYRLTD